MVIRMDFVRDLRESLDPGRVMNVKRFLNMPTLESTLTISFVGIPIVRLSVSLTRKETSFERVMEPFGDLMGMVTKFGFGHDD
jgi:hypothetical protein